MSPVDPERLARLTRELRKLSAGLNAPDPDPDQWVIDLYRYDDLLITVADLLEVPVSGPVRDAMGAHDRAALEEALEEAGVDAWDQGAQAPPSSAPASPSEGS